MSSAYDWAPGGCCCKTPYEAWASDTSDQLAIINLTKKVGEPENSESDFSFDDDENATHIAAMAFGEHVFIVQDTGSGISVARYHNETGVLSWNQTGGSITGSYGYVQYGNDVAAGSINHFNVNATQFWNNKTKELFESTGVTTKSATPNTTSDARDGNSADWIPRKLSSHGFPACAGWRRKYINESITHTSTTPLGGGNYRHDFDIDYDEVIETGVGDYDIDTGDMTSVTSAHTTAAASHSTTGSITNTNPTPPSPSLSDFGGLPSHWAFTNLTMFSSDGTNYVFDYLVQNTDTGTRYTYVIVNGNIAKSDSRSTTPVLALDSAAYVHDAPTEPGYAVALITYEDPDNPGEYYAEGYDDSGGLEWSEQVYDESRWISVNDTWALIYSPMTVSTDVAPDGRDWSGLSSPTAISYWLVRLDNAEWEPCRKETTSTTWSNHSDPTPSIQQIDMVKSASHPYGPPLTTYGTTPP